MRQYHELLNHILASGNDRGSRAGGTRSVFGYQFRHDLNEGFPLLTTKRLPFKAIVVELLWFLRGDTNIKYLLENGVHIWSADAYRVYKAKWGHLPRHQETLEEFEAKILADELFPAGEFSDTFAKMFGDMGPMYGKQWRRWQGHQVDSVGRIGFANPLDQIKNVIDGIRKNPEGRRHIVTAWNPAEVDAMALPPCHCLYQFYVDSERLSCHMYQRSADVFLGVPFNIASYALLTHIIAHQCNLGVGDLVISFGDVHIYNNHREQVLEQLSREPRPLPGLKISPVTVDDVGDYVYEDFTLTYYNPHPAIKGELSVG